MPSVLVTDAGRGIGKSIVEHLAAGGDPSKFALEAAADALRMELRPWHIDVAVVEPAQTALCRRDRPPTAGGLDD